MIKDKFELFEPPKKVWLIIQTPNQGSQEIFHFNIFL